MSAFAILNLPDRRLLGLGLGAAPEPPFVAEAHLRWVLARYGERREEQWRVPPDEGGLLLMKMYYEELPGAATSELLTPILWAFAFYGTATGYSRHLARERLADPDLQRRVAALWVLGATGDAENVAAVDPVLAAPGSPVIRRAAIIALTKLVGADRFDGLAAAATGDLELEEVVALGDARRQAADRGDTRAFLRLNLAHEVFFEDLAGAARFVVKELGDVFADESLSPLQRQRAARVFGLAHVSPRKSSNTAGALAADQSQPLELRVECIRMLGRVRSRPAVPVLVPLLGDAAPAVQEAAVEALGEIGDVGDATAGVLGALLNHDDDRGGAMRPLIALAAWRLARPVDEQTYLRFASGEADVAPHFGYFFAPDGVTTALPREEALALLADPRTDVRREAAFLLAALGTDADAAALRDLAAREPDELTRRIAARGAALAADRRAP